MEKAMREELREQLECRGMPENFFDVKGSMALEEWKKLPKGLQVPHLFEMGIVTFEDALKHCRRRAEAHLQAEVAELLRVQQENAPLEEVALELERLATVAGHLVAALKELKRPL